MTDLPATSDEDRPRRLPWAAPEIAVAGILAAFAALSVGGLAAGVDSSANGLTPYLDSFGAIWGAIQAGSAWASAILAAVLLGAVGLSWWQAERWVDDTEESSPDRETALGYIARARLLALWVRVALAITAVGAIAQSTATIGLFVIDNSQAQITRIIIVSVANTVGVLAIAGAAVLISRRQAVG